VSRGATVAQHVAMAASPLRVEANRKEAVRILERGQGEHKLLDLLKQPWLWLAAGAALMVLLVSIGALAWLLKPLDEATLMARAETLIATGEEDDQKTARRRYLEPLLARFPDGAHAARARELIDAMEVEEAQRKIDLSIRFNRQPKSEIAQQYLEAYTHQKYGNHQSAKEAYEAILKREADGRPGDKPYFALAKKNLPLVVQAAIDEAKEKARLVDEELVKAEELASSGDLASARKIWMSLLTRLQDDEAFTVQAEHAAIRLKETEPQADGQASEGIEQ
jgi:hypothetical protein